MTRRGLLGVLLRNGERFFVDKDEFVIGRVPACDLWIPDGNLSKRQCAIVRREGRWGVVDLESTSGTLVNGLKIRGPTALAAGSKIRFGDHHIHVLDLDHEPAPGELTAPVRRRLELTCPPLLCRARVSLASMTGSAALDAEVDDMVRATGGVAEGSQLRFDDPVALVLAVKRLQLHGDDDRRGLHRRVCGLELRVTQYDLVFGQAALELLAESTVPALAAWRWLMQSARFQVAPALLRGLALDLQRIADPGVRDQLVAASTAPPGGLRAWLTTNSSAQLLWIDHPVAIGMGGGEIRAAEWPAPLAIERTPSGWRARGEVPQMFAAAFVDEPLVAGTRVALYPAGSLDVIAVS